MLTRRRRLLQLAWFAAAMLAAVAFRESYPFAPESDGLDQALVWLPTGVAIAGLWLLGLRAAWVIAVCTICQRLWIGYSMAVWIPAAIGSTTEAVLGAWLLRRLGLRGDFASLRELLLLLLVATTAPLASILSSWLGRALPGSFRDLPLHSGWDGWWRMNVLGTLTVVPVALLWLGRRCPRRRLDGLATLANAAVTAVITAVVMLALRPGLPSIMMLTLVLPMALLAAMRDGPRGACTSASVGTLVIAAIAAGGGGSFLYLPPGERHTAVQVFLLLLTSVPLVFGALIAERDANAAQWLQSEGLRRALMRVLPDIVYRIHPDNTYVDVMVPEGTRLPIDREQILGRRVQDLVAPGISARLLAEIERARHGQPTQPVEYPLPTATGLRDREVRYVPLPDGDVIGVVRDITERKRAERQLAWQAEILERIAAGRPTAEIFAALVHELEATLPRARGALLLRRGRRLFLSCAPSLPATYAAAVDGFEIGPGRATCGAAAHENRTVVAADIESDPQWLPWRDLMLDLGIRACWSVPLRSADGTVLGTFASYHPEPYQPTQPALDFVERVAILAGLAIDRERRENQLASILRNVGEGLFRSVPGEGLVHVNPAFARLFGYESPTAMLAELQTPGSPSEHRTSLEQLLAITASTRHQEMQLCRRCGTRFTALVSTTVTQDDTGGPVCDGAVADVTARRELEEQLRHAQKMEAVGQLAGGVAHDFNNLLTAIVGYAEAVHDGLRNDDPLVADVAEIQRAASRAADLTRQLLAVGRRQVLSPRTIDLPLAVDRLLGMLRRVIGEHITVTSLKSGRGVCARVDQGQLEQLLLNLALNARDAMPGGGQLTIGTDAVMVDAATARAHPGLREGQYAVLWVADNGTGMTPEVQARAFDPFFTTKAPGHGTGLGLSTVYGIVTQSGGALWIDSAIGRGTTVWIYLPRVAAAQEPEPTLTLPRPMTQRATVLVVEDEALVRDLVQRTLTRAGHHVLVAEDGEQALAIATARPQLDAIVTDVVMPRCGGRELVQRLSATHRTTPVLFMSGYASDGEGLLATGSRRTQLLHKPFTATQLLEALEQVLSTAPLPTSSVPGSLGTNPIGPSTTGPAV
ncbi:MAG: MASE1 domain-containing protein [Planctomycetes bacterium]|jgi:PAS domain S-box-containing protein|nr:MASE1 domain-containing protein [Planctomycetota bacterium]